MRQPTKKEREEFVAAAKTLDSLGKKGFYIYLAMDSLCLMTGPSHLDDRDQTANFGAIVAQVTIKGSGGGDF